MKKKRVYFNIEEAMKEEESCMGKKLKEKKLREKSIKHAKTVENFYNKLTWVDLCEIAEKELGFEIDNHKRTTIGVRFCVCADTLDAEKITEALGVRPGWTEWDEDKNAYVLWEYRSGKIETLNVYKALRSVEKIFVPKKKILQELKEECGVEYSIEIAANIRNNQAPDLSLHSSTIKFADEIGADISISTSVQKVGIYKIPDQLQETVRMIESYTPAAVWRRWVRKKLEEKRSKTAESGQEFEKPETGGSHA